MVSGFVRSGLQAGDQVWCFPNGLRSEVLSRLHEDGVADHEPMASGQLTIMPTHESALAGLATDPGGVIDGLRRAVDGALGAGWNGFRIVGDLGWATCGRSCPPQLLDLEVRIGELLAGSPAAALCQYDRNRYDDATMVALIEVHATAVEPAAAPQAEHLMIGPLLGPAGLWVVGDVDLSTREVFRVALEATLQWPPGDLHLELSGVTFIDVGGVQLILRAARRLEPGGRMVLHRSPRSLRLALGLLSGIPETISLVDVEAQAV